MYSSLAEAYWEPCKTSNMEHLWKQLTTKTLTFFEKPSILDVWRSIEYADFVDVLYNK